MCQVLGLQRRETARLRIKMIRVSFIGIDAGIGKHKKLLDRFNLDRLFPRRNVKAFVRALQRGCRIDFMSFPARSERTIAL